MALDQSLNRLRFFVFARRSFEMQVENSFYGERLVALLASAFGVLARLLAALGLYGVIAFNVTRRTGEIGLRMALGAVPRDVLAMVMKEVALMVGAGTVIGLPVALLLSRYVESQLFGLKASDPLMYAAATVALAAVALIAGYIPARRAARIDPIRAFGTSDTWPALATATLVHLESRLGRRMRTSRRSSPRWRRAQLSAAARHGTHRLLCLPDRLPHRLR